MRTRRSSFPHDTVRSLALALDAKDPQIRHHSDRVARYAYALGERLGLDVERLERLTAAALLHDVGVLAVPDALLLRDVVWLGRPAGCLQPDDELLPHELDIVREHAVIGGRILDAAGLPDVADW